MKPRQHLHFSTDAEDARDLRLALLWISALLAAGTVANLAAVLFGAGQ